MAFEKGKSGNPNGRPEGVPNKSAQKVKEAFTKLLEANLPRLQEDIDALDPKDRIHFIKDLSEYILPKLARVESDINATVNSESRQVFKIGDTIIEL